jgi:DNA polymerase
MPSEREDLIGIARDLRGHLVWLRENGVGEVPAPARPPAAPARPSAGAGPAPGSLRAAARAAAGMPPLTETPSGRAERGEGSPRTRGPLEERPSAGLFGSSERPLAGAGVARNTVQAGEGPNRLATPVRATALGAAPTSLGPARSLEEVRAEIGDCQRCKLARGRKNLVFGVGNPKAELVFVGEGPGEEEDNQGIPFVGRAGQLLTKMIEAMGFARSEVYICNVVKCRPPNNRNPEPDEIEACEGFLRAQLSSLKPKIIVALGKFAAQTLLRDATPISRLRGSWREYCGVKLMPTFHPAYLLRSPEEKKKAWLDLQLVMKEFGKAKATSKKSD